MDHKGFKHLTQLHWITNSLLTEDWTSTLDQIQKPGPGFTKGLKTKNCLNFKRKVLTVQEFCHKVKTFLLRQNGIHTRS